MSQQLVREPIAEQTTSLEGTDDRTPSSRHLDGLDGLRAVAVCSVVLFHFGIGGISGGFLGVDLFFVLSGFLITRLLIQEQDRSQHVGVGAFLIRRARRLYPALVTMVALVTLAALVLRPRGLTQGLFGDTWSSLIYVANWHFIHTSSDYFASSTSLFTHLWSLSIEGQFYIVWPLVVVGLLKVRHSKLALGVVAVVGAIASMIGMRLLFEENTSLTRLYEGTDTHAQGLLIGALLAVVLSIWASQDIAKRSRLVRLCMTTIAILALGCVVMFFFVTSGLSPFLYGGGFFVFSLLTALVIFGIVVDQGSILTKALSLRPIAFVGLISYSLYLWHYPVLLLVTHKNTGLTSWGLFAVRLAITAVLSVASFYLVERPVRRKNLLASNWHALIAALVIAGLSLSFAGLAQASANAGSQVSIRGDRVSTSNLQGALAPLPTSGTNTASPVGAFAGSNSVNNIPVVQPGTKGILVVGDSMAQAFANWFEFYQIPSTHSAAMKFIEPSIANRLPQFQNLASRFTLANYGTAGCATQLGNMVLQGQPSTPSDPCDPNGPGPLWPQIWQTVVDKFNPAVSIYEARLDLVDRIENGQDVHIGQPAYDAQLLASLNRVVSILSARGGKVLLATSPYYSSGEQPNGTPWPEDAPARVELYNQLLGQVALEHPSTVGILDLGGLVSPANQFASWVDGIPVRAPDGIHWSFQGDAWLWMQLLPQIAQWAEKPPVR
jgi:peptidoglycan/LPS O-acetylase OafA/YrhL